MNPISAPEDVGALWLQTLQRAMARASHDVKDALNGVSVNLEVIRTRAERADVPATAVAQFAEAAGNQLERLTTLLDAVLALSRPEREPVDVAFTLRRVAVLCSASASSADAAVSLVEADLLANPSSRIDGSAVRAALLVTLLDASTGTDRSHPVSGVTCTMSSEADGVAVVIAAEGRRVAMPESATDTLRAAGVRWTDDARALTLFFSRA